MKIFVDSIGCRLNHSEMETLARQLLAAGHEIVAEVDQADKVILNTCAVTAEAAREARQRTRRFHRSNDAAELILTGCYATIAPEEVGNVTGVGRVVSNQDKERLALTLDPKARIDIPLFDQEPILREFHAGTVSHTRAFIKVQDGCDNKCTFCVTTVARGEGASRHLGDVVAEVQALEKAGYREIVLSGVHLGSYGRDLDQPDGLRQLLRSILTHTTIPRIRLSSLEPWDIVPGFFDLWQNPRLLPHLHLPLQSGSDAILRKMARRTRRSDFRQLVAEAQAAIPDLNLTSDIIVGFPGETEEDFVQSLDFVREIGFSRLHVFPYSPRPGTAAAKMGEQVPKKIKKERMGRMLAAAKALSESYHRRYVTRTVDVLWESILGANGDGFMWSGYSDNYIRVTASGPEDLLNRVTPLRVTAASADGLTGEVLLPAE